MTTNNPIAELLAAPLGSDWTVEELAEQVLDAVATECSDEEVILDANAIADRQTYRLLRPLIACLATKSAAEAGTPANLYGGNLSFKRAGSTASVQILGQFDNRPGSVRLTLRRTLRTAETDPYG